MMLISIFKGVLIGLIAYGLGSLSFAYIITKLLTGKDIRTVGSGNAGFTNAMRVLSKPWAFFIFFLDVLKAYVACWFGLFLLGPIGGVISLGAVVLGHNYPFWLQFKGGKGIATGLGGLLAITPWIAILMLTLWAVVVLISGYVSLGSIVAALSMPVFAVAFQQPALYVFLYSLVCILVVCKHRSNIKRIKEGIEPKIPWKRAK